MTAKSKPTATKEASRFRTLALKLGITDPDLVKKLKMAIELAQGGRQDLDITFSQVG